MNDEVDFRDEVMMRAISDFQRGEAGWWLSRGDYRRGTSTIEGWREIKSYRQAAG